MKRPHFSAFLSIGLALIATLLRASTDPILPIDPAELLKAMPPVPPEWKCVKSTGKVDFAVMGIPQTTVTRSYQVSSPPEVQPPTSGSIMIVAMDLGTMGDPQVNPPVANKGPDVFTLPAVTGTLREYVNKSLVFSGTIGTRLLVQVTARDIQPDAFKKLLQKLDLSNLVSLEKRLPTTPLKPQAVQEAVNGGTVTSQVYTLQTVIIDEINPARNRTSKASCVATGL